MKLLIQLTFNNGLGNLYCGAIELLNFANHYKELGYQCDLIFASNVNAGGNKFIDLVDFEEIFDLSSFEIFDTITNTPHSIGVKEYEGYIYHSTQYGPNHPGAHWWDVFFDEFPENEVYPKYAFNMETLLRNECVPKWVPKLNKKIYDKVDDFFNKNGKSSEAIQVRYNDYTPNPPDEFKNFCINLTEKLKSIDKTFYVTSHNKFAIDTISILPNVSIYEYKHLDVLPNDHCYYFYHKNFEREILLDRLYDNLSEMVILSHFDTIYFSSSISWTTTFLYYSKSNNPSQKLININNNLDLIE